MKKFLSVFVLILALSFSIYADGEIPIGGRSCPPNETCPADPPPPGTPPGFVSNIAESGDSGTAGNSENSDYPDKQEIYSAILTFLRTII